MPYPADTIKCGIAGRMPNGTRFSFGFQTRGGQGAASTQVAAAVTSMEQFLTSSNAPLILSYMSTDTVIDTLSAYHYAGGNQADAVETASVSHPGSGNFANTPNQVAIVASLRSASNTRQGRGRMFIPLTGANLVSGQLPAAGCQDIAKGVQALFASFSGAGDGLPQTPVVASATHGIARDIVRIIVDSRTDVIRHRAQGETVLHAYTQEL